MTVIIKIIIGLIVLSEIIKRIRKSERVQARIKKALGIKGSPSEVWRKDIGIWIDPGHGGRNENQKS